MAQSKCGDGGLPAWLSPEVRTCFTVLMACFCDTGLSHTNMQFSTSCAAVGLWNSMNSN